MADTVSRIPPSSLDAEQSILGAMLLSESCVFQAAERLKDALTEWKLCACRHEEDDYADFTDCTDWEEGC